MHARSACCAAVPRASWLSIISHSLSFQLPLAWCLRIVPLRRRTAHQQISSGPRDVLCIRIEPIYSRRPAAAARRTIKKSMKSISRVCTVARHARPWPGTGSCLSLSACQRPCQASEAHFGRREIVVTSLYVAPRARQCAHAAVACGDVESSMRRCADATHASCIPRQAGVGVGRTTDDVDAGR
ncbi:hypothetical protein C8Q73DRAFT_90102 [Cubamyces lactineus]|nr:hypothetical protein C8Q73DRAFT_90102 [Cubamyces lactineus]